MPSDRVQLSTKQSAAIGVPEPAEQCVCAGKQPGNARRSESWTCNENDQHSR